MLFFYFERILKNGFQNDDDDDDDNNNDIFFLNVSQIRILAYHRNKLFKIIKIVNSKTVIFNCTNISQYYCFWSNKYSLCKRFL